jgi:ABC-type Mn2+/Zn2+ transport system permease subunit
MELLTEPFAYGFMRTALLAGVLTVVSSSLVGTWIVMRGLAFMGDALAHGVLPGIAIAYLAGTSLLLGASVGAAAMVVGISAASSRRGISQDTAIGLLYVGMLALGVTIISARGAYAGDLTSILFGDPIGVGAEALRVLTLAATAAAALSALLYRPFIALTYDRAKAQVLEMHPRLAHLVMLALIAMVVVTSFRAVGTMLVVAFLIAPPATAVLIVRRVPIIMLTSMLFGSLAVVLGLVLSFHYSTATSATIAGLTVVQFFLVLTTVAVIDRWRRHPLDDSAGRRPVPATT